MYFYKHIKSPEHAVCDKFSLRLNHTFVWLAHLYRYRFFMLECPMF